MWAAILALSPFIAPQDAIDIKWASISSSARNTSINISKTCVWYSSSRVIMRIIERKM